MWIPPVGESAEVTLWALYYEYYQTIPYSEVQRVNLWAAAVDMLRGNSCAHEIY